MADSINYNKISGETAFGRQEDFTPAQIDQTEIKNISVSAYSYNGIKVGTIGAGSQSNYIETIKITKKQWGTSYVELTLSQLPPFPVYYGFLLRIFNRSQLIASAITQFSSDFKIKNQYKKIVIKGFGFYDILKSVKYNSISGGDYTSPTTLTALFSNGAGGIFSSSFDWSANGFVPTTLLNIPQNLPTDTFTSFTMKRQDASVSAILDRFFMSKNMKLASGGVDPLYTWRWYIDDTPQIRILVTKPQSTKIFAKYFSGIYEINENSESLVNFVDVVQSVDGQADTIVFSKKDDVSIKKYGLKRDSIKLKDSGSQSSTYWDSIISQIFSSIVEPKKEVKLKDTEKSLDFFGFYDINFPIQKTRKFLEYNPIALKSDIYPGAGTFSLSDGQFVFTKSFNVIPNAFLAFNFFYFLFTPSIVDKIKNGLNATPYFYKFEFYILAFSNIVENSIDVIITIIERDPITMSEINRITMTTKINVVPIGSKSNDFTKIIVNFQFLNSVKLIQFVHINGINNFLISSMSIEQNEALTYSDFINQQDIEITDNGVINDYIFGSKINKISEIIDATK